MGAVTDDRRGDMKKIICTGALALAFGSAMAQSSVNLDFSGSGNNLAATGFDSVINEDTGNYNVSGGWLSITTQAGDIYGRYESSLDPDDAKNVFSSTIDTTAGTVVDAVVSAVGLNTNFHGGGIWLGLDTDHYIRLGIINNGNELHVEALRENEELWNDPGSGHNGPGGDIVGSQSASIGASGVSSDVENVHLRLVRTGSTADAFYSLDGVTYTQVGSTFTDLQIGAGAFTESSTMHVGAYAFGGPVGQTPGTVKFDSLHAQAVPEPATMAALGLGAVALIKRRRKG